MKNNKIELYRWLPSEGENIEIDWPKVHNKIGLDHTKWLLAQTHDRCQLVLESNDQYCRLIAEFFDQRLEVEYQLRWR
jgi:hypothetical protein